MRKDFKKMAKKFGKVDKKTREFRRRCKEAGFSVVFYDGMTQDEALEVIESDEMKELTDLE